MPLMQHNELLASVLVPLVHFGDCSGVWVVTLHVSKEEPPFDMRFASVRSRPRQSPLPSPHLESLLQSVALPFRLCLGALLAVLLVRPVLGQTVIYVDNDATGANDGTSWLDAFVYLQDALTVAQDGDEVWVARGVYKPDEGIGVSPNDRAAAFHVAAGVALIGGFAGDETSIEQRSLTEHTSVLTGDLIGNDPTESFPHPDSAAYSDNSHSILEFSPDPHIHPSILDGLTIRGANGRQSAIRIWSSPCRLRNLVVTENIGNAGAGASVSDCEVDEVTFVRNNAHYSRMNGGALEVWGGAVVRNSRFEDNYAFEGGGLHVTGSDTALVSNSLFVSNTAWDGGAVAIVPGATLAIASSVFVSNVATCSGGVFQVDEATELIIINGLFDANTSMEDCDELKGGGVGFVYQGVLTVHNSTFVLNSSVSLGDVLAIHQGSVQLYNSILSNNGDAGSAPDIVSTESAITAGHMLVDNSLPPEVTIVGPILSGTPHFVDPDGSDGIPGTVDDDFRLSSGSVGIEEGNIDILPRDYTDLDSDQDSTEPIPFDLAGKDRVWPPNDPLAKVDLGAYEFSGSTARRHPYVTIPFQPECAIDVFPLPFRESVSVLIRGVQPHRLDLFEISGRRITSWSAQPPLLREGALFRLDTSSLPSGIYLLRAITRSGTCSTPIVRN